MHQLSYLSISVVMHFPFYQIRCFMHLCKFAVLMRSCLFQTWIIKSKPKFNMDEVHGFHLHLRICCAVPLLDSVQCSCVSSEWSSFYVTMNGCQQNSNMSGFGFFFLESHAFFGVFIQGHLYTLLPRKGTRELSGSWLRMVHSCPLRWMTTGSTLPSITALD